jgi:gliding motility-associated-like protein
MPLRKILRNICLFCFLLSAGDHFSQGLHFFVHTTPEVCQKGKARFEVTGHYDSLNYHWSTGQVNIPSINNLDAGDYWLTARVVYKEDTVKRSKDTTLIFKIEKELCPLLIPKYFSPNGDGYNDLFTIGNIESFPNFELLIYNKWGQRVHYQKGSFIPWDGKWLGSDLADGAYYYVLYYNKDNTSEFLKDDVTILR